MEFGHSIVKFSSENKSNVLSEKQTMDVKPLQSHWQCFCEVFCKVGLRSAVPSIRVWLALMRVTADDWQHDSTPPIPTSGGKTDSPSHRIYRQKMFSITAHIKRATVLSLFSYCFITVNDRKTIFKLPFKTGTTTRLTSQVSSTSARGCHGATADHWAQRER